MPEEKDNSGEHQEKSEEISKIVKEEMEDQQKSQQPPKQEQEKPEEKKEEPAPQQPKKQPEPAPQQESTSSWSSWLTSTVSNVYDTAMTTTNQIGESVVSFVKEEMTPEESQAQEKKEGQIGPEKDIIDTGIETLQNLSTKTTQVVEDMVKSGQEMLENTEDIQKYAQETFNTAANLTSSTLNNLTETTVSTSSWLLNSAKLLFNDSDDKPVDFNVYFQDIDPITVMQAFTALKGKEYLQVLEELSTECDEQAKQFELTDDQKKVLEAFKKFLDTSVFSSQDPLTDEQKLFAQSINGREIQNLSKQADQISKQFLHVQKEFVSSEQFSEKLLIALTNQLIKRSQRKANETYAALVNKGISHVFGFCDQLCNVQQKLFIPYELKTNFDKKGPITADEAAQQIQNYGRFLINEMNLTARKFSKTIQTLNSFCNSQLKKESKEQDFDELKESMDELTINTATDCILQNDQAVQIFTDAFQFVNGVLDYTVIQFAMDTKKPEQQQQDQPQEESKTEEEKK